MGYVSGYLGHHHAFHDSGPGKAPQVGTYGGVGHPEYNVEVRKWVNRRMSKATEKMGPDEMKKMIDKIRYMDPDVNPTIGKFNQGIKEARHKALKGLPSRLSEETEALIKRGKDILTGATIRRARRLATTTVRRAIPRVVRTAAKKTFRVLAGKTCRSVATKVVPVLIIWSWSEKVEAKGPGGGTVSTIAGEIPFFGWGWEAGEIFFGWGIPDLPEEQEFEEVEVTEEMDAEELVLAMSDSEWFEKFEPNLKRQAETAKMTKASYFYYRDLETGQEMGPFWAREGAVMEMIEAGKYKYDAVLVWDPKEQKYSKFIKAALLPLP